MNIEVTELMMVAVLPFARFLPACQISSSSSDSLPSPSFVPFASFIPSLHLAKHHPPAPAQISSLSQVRTISPTQRRFRILSTSVLERIPGVQKSTRSEDQKSKIPEVQRFKNSEVQKSKCSEVQEARSPAAENPEDGGRGRQAPKSSVFQDVSTNE